MAKTVIIGAGNVGRTLVNLVEETIGSLIVVDEDKDVCSHLATEKSITVVHGDATETNLLDELELEDAEHVFAVTGTEEVNFLVSAYAKQAGAKRVICRVKSSKYSKVLEKMGIESIVAEYTLATELANRITFPVIHKLLNPLESGLEVIEKPADKSMVGKTLQDIHLEPSSLVIAFYQDGKYHIATNMFEVGPRTIIVMLRERKKSLI